MPNPDHAAVVAKEWIAKAESVIASEARQSPD
jgi:hypothetical protein